MCVAVTILFPPTRRLSDSTPTPLSPPPSLIAAPAAVSSSQRLTCHRTFPMSPTLQRKMSPNPRVQRGSSVRGRTLTSRGPEDVATCQSEGRDLIREDVCTKHGNGEVLLEYYNHAKAELHMNIQ